MKIKRRGVGIALRRTRDAARVALEASVAAWDRAVRYSFGVSDAYVVCFCAAVEHAAAATAYQLWSEQQNAKARGLRYSPAPLLAPLPVVHRWPDVQKCWPNKEHSR